MKIKWIAGLLLTCFFVQQCAKQTAPTGGSKDEKPPNLIKSSPRHQEINVTRSTIELTFDERIQLNNPREQIIITPTVGKKFETTFNKNKVELDLKTALQENTTYNINFREAIQDLNEKNPANIKLAFSTGSYIDSLSINGKIADAITEKEAVNYIVALAPASDTFNIFKHSASWITLTDKRGFFSIENLKPGEYSIYAFEDKSKNLIVDSKTEQYGFAVKNIQLQKNIDSLKIRTFKLDVNQLKLITARPTFAYFNLRFSKSLVNYSVIAGDSSRRIYSTLEPDLTTLKLYNTLNDLDSLRVRVQATDSLNFQIDTLIYIKFPKKEATHDKFSAKIETTTIQESNSLFSSTVKFSKPVAVFSADSVFIEIDSLNKLFFTKNEYKWNDGLSELSLTKKIDLTLLYPKDTAQSQKSKTNQLPRGNPPAGQGVKNEIKLTFTKGAFISIENDTAAAQSIPVTLIKLELTGVIETTVKTQENFILQLINKNNVVVREALNQKDAVFENLPPDTYILRIMIDLNKNDKWDPGNYYSATEPEPIIYYRNVKNIKEITLKANWHRDGLLITY